MKFYLKIFILAVVCFSLMIFSGMYAFNKHYVDNSEDYPTDEEIANAEENSDASEAPDDSEEEIKEVKKTKLEKLIEQSDRVNVLLYGLEGPRADTIILASYDPEKNIADLVSIPRDTYNPIEGYNGQGQKKINATYGLADIGGAKGMKKIISDFLDVPIDYYVQVRYSGVEAIIDTIGGVKVNIPFKMEYDDPYDDPPLHIYFEPGTQTLSGEEAVKYLRWRKNNGEDGRGDLYRIQRQQDFIMKAFRKSVGLRLPIVVKTAMNYVRTDMPIQNALYYAAKASDIDFEKIEFHQIPGEPGSNGSGYYIHHPQEMEDMFEEIYAK